MVKQIEKQKTRTGAEFYISGGFLKYKFFLTDQIAMESKALHGKMVPRDKTQHRNERGSIQTKGFQSQKSLTVKSRKCKLLFSLEM